MDLHLSLAIYPLDILKENSEETSTDGDLSSIGNPELVDFFDRDLNKNESASLKNLENLTGIIANRNFDITMLSINYHNGGYYAVDGEKQYLLQDGDCLTLKNYVIQVSINNNSQIVDMQKAVFFSQDENDYYEDIEIPRVNDSRLVDTTQQSFSLQKKYSNNQNDLFFEKNDTVIRNNNENFDSLNCGLNSYLELPSTASEKIKNRTITSSEQKINIGVKNNRNIEPNILTELGIIENDARLSEYDDIRNYQSMEYKKPINFIEEIYDDNQQKKYNKLSVSSKSPPSYSRRYGLISTFYRKNKFLMSLKKIKRIILD